MPQGGCLALRGYKTPVTMGEEGRVCWCPLASQGCEFFRLPVTLLEVAIVLIKFLFLTTRALFAEDYLITFLYSWKSMRSE